MSLKLRQSIQKLGKEIAIATAKNSAEDIGMSWQGGLPVVFNAIANDPERAPGNIGGSHDDEQTTIRKWILKYQGGFNGRASVRISNHPGTVADPIIEKIIAARITDLSEEELKKITYAHRLGMSAENILGLILEEYLANHLEAFGWYCAWGETVKSVDFVHKDGRLLQIKNRSNSEDSSSSAVRSGTQIEKWFRIKADRIEYMWNTLNEICGTTDLNEEGFITFVNKVIKKNPSCMAVEHDNPWRKQS